MKNKTLIQVLLSITLAVLAGFLAGTNGQIFSIPLYQIFGLIGQVFLNALTLVVVPLVASSIILGAARMGKDGSFSTLGKTTFIYFLLTMAIAVSIGILTTVIMQPGVNQALSVANLSSDQIAKLSQIEAQGQGGSFHMIQDLLLKLVPANILMVAAQGQMLGLIFFSLLFGYFSTKIEERLADVMMNFWNALFQIMMKITHLVMSALPIGVFGLVAKAVATTGVESFGSIAKFTITVLIALAIYMLGVLSILLKGVAGVNPLRHLKIMLPALLTAFSTSSSAATLPLTLECLEKKAQVSNRVCSFVVPLGTSLNLSGSALYVAAAVFFIAQSYGIVMGFSTILTVFLLIIFSSIGMAGIPSACLVALVLILNTIGLPADAIGLILAVERLLDMCRTVVNVYGTSCCAILVARKNGEKVLVHG